MHRHAASLVKTSIYARLPAAESYYDTSIKFIMVLRNPHDDFITNAAC